VVASSPPAEVFGKLPKSHERVDVAILTSRDQHLQVRSLEAAVWQLAGDVRKR
jgi:hypothetical protein